MHPYYIKCRDTAEILTLANVAPIHYNKITNSRLILFTVFKGSEARVLSSHSCPLWNTCNTSNKTYSSV